MRVRTTTPRIGTRAPNLHTISRIFSPLPANQSRTVFVAIADNPRRSRSPASRSGGAPRGRKRYPDADCLQSPRRQRQQQRLHAARLKVQPAAPGNTGVAGRADERRVPASWSPGLPKRPARTGAICWRSLGWLRRPGADGASPTALQPPPHLLTTLPAPAGGGRCVGPGRQPRAREVALGSRQRIVDAAGLQPVQMPFEASARRQVHPGPRVPVAAPTRSPAATPRPGSAASTTASRR